MAKTENTNTTLLRPAADGARYELTSPTALPKAGGFLWNQQMMIQVTCRGYATAQHMQPEPAKYAHAPNLEARTFMQPEQNYYAHHPGRFVYVKDEETNELFSAPYEPVRAAPDRFVFSVGQSDIKWTVERLGIRVEMTLGVPTHDVVELWSVRVTNLSGRPRRISVYPYFPFGYMSWMNLSAEWRPDLGAVVASSITPYQKAEDYFKNNLFKDKSYFLCETPPTSWEAMQQTFEDEGGLHAPSAVLEPELKGGDARYETPAAAVQYRVKLEADEKQEYRFLFGPALDDAEIKDMRARYLSKEGFARCAEDYSAYILKGRGCLQIETPDKDLDNFVNNWLPRQCYYHGDVNRLTTDPQTRNYLQDNMGMTYIKPEVARKAFLIAAGQQEENGAMPDGILLAEGAELKYINQVPHTDHCVWLPVTLEAYLAETADYALLDEVVKGMHGDTYTVFERFSRAMDWLLSARDERGLSYIAQGDWCDPMNMVGYKGKGVSGWLTLATAYAVNIWANVCEQQGKTELATRYRAGAREVNDAANAHLWDGDWFARGITDDNVIFGVKKDAEGRIWLNPQTWSILGGGASAGQIARMLPAVDEQLSTPYGVVMFAPAYSAMREDVGRVTQKFPGSAENGSVYNHAAVFYVHSLYSVGERDRAYKALRQMIPGPTEEDYVQRGQLPVYIPNYYRGAWHEYPRTAGRSSQLFNTGTVSWAYRCFIEGLCGLRGDPDGLVIQPQLPSDWDGIKVTRLFRGATFIVDVRKVDVDKVVVKYEGQELPEARFRKIEPGKTYELTHFNILVRNHEAALAKLIIDGRRSHLVATLAELDFSGLDILAAVNRFSEAFFPTMESDMKLDVSESGRASDRAAAMEGLRQFGVWYMGQQERHGDLWPATETDRRPISHYRTFAQEVAEELLSIMHDVPVSGHKYVRACSWDVACILRMWGVSWPDGGVTALVERAIQSKLDRDLNTAEDVLETEGGDSGKAALWVGLEYWCDRWQEAECGALEQLFGAVDVPMVEGSLRVSEDLQSGTEMAQAAEDASASSTSKDSCTVHELEDVLPDLPLLPSHGMLHYVLPFGSQHLVSLGRLLRGESTSALERALVFRSARVGLRSGRTENQGWLHQVVRRPAKISKHALADEVFLSRLLGSAM
ncbi:Uu.00g126330.m01.CDS01 [Anthostomella pinea]|uniref:Uu.00g126330.m01.CDS01 n=1 Tax=Anthostomella pinea TaxID=933095 RepID=A0AAI8VHV4_9PEZI|nr:Uu.00g126330.m01.CDS01 [Anthostomella pinea]